MKIEYRLLDLVRIVRDDTAILQIQESVNDEHHLSVLMLRDYMIGFDLTKKEFLFGKRKSASWFTQDKVFKLILIINIFIFVVSVFVITITRQFMPRNKVEVRRQEQGHRKSGFNPSKTSGY